MGANGVRCSLFQEILDEAPARRSSVRVLHRNATNQMMRSTTIIQRLSSYTPPLATSKPGFAFFILVLII